MSSDSSSDLLVIGKVGAAYGVKGWVKLISFMAPPDNILSYSHFTLADDKEQRVIEIDQSRPQGKGFVGHIKGCDDKDLTREYTGKELMLSIAVLPELDSSEFYWFQLKGLTVLTLEDENLGKVDHLIETGANDVLVVKPDADSIDDQERLIPYIADKIVREVNLEKKFIKLDWQADYLITD